MSTVDSRIALAAGWLQNNMVQVDADHAGWGWSPDVAPNPQDTAEAVCALAAARSYAPAYTPVPLSPDVYNVPQPDAVSALVRANSVVHAAQGEWTFQSPVDAAWRLRALIAMSNTGVLPDVSAYRNSLLTSQDQHSGGWAMSEGSAWVSVSATTAAISALLELPPSDVQAALAIQRGCDFLTQALMDDDPRATTNAASAKIACLLGTGRLADSGNAHLAKAHANAVDRVLHYLETAPGTLEEEPIRRGNVTQTWYHATLPISIMALATSKKRLTFHPTFRRGFTELLDYQQMLPSHRDYGGFKTSRGGLITSYATAQSIEALSCVASDVRVRVNPGQVFDILCDSESRHHTDPQNISLGNLPPIRINSNAGAGFFGLGLAAGVTIITLALLFREDKDKPSSADVLSVPTSGALIYWGTALIAIGGYCWAAARFHQFPRAKVISLVVALLTAGVLPFFAFLLN
ncbi:hypothetical protein [Nocardia camponoti]|uniref:Uncharacterized protein n=1 Tax=Nocardia camponoti TaxID=1616106 RepID=A0A917QT00_9NOCA|nr:hypothetical protein [Nocardia camponoti]GGK66753.1 hypothetical protein GCM10011591_43630 [Nocardia camponoti]